MKGQRGGAGWSTGEEGTRQQDDGTTQHRCTHRERQMTLAPARSPRRTSTSCAGSSRPRRPTTCPRQWPLRKRSPSTPAWRSSCCLEVGQIPLLGSGIRSFWPNWDPIPSFKHKNLRNSTISSLAFAKKHQILLREPVLCWNLDLQ